MLCFTKVSVVFKMLSINLKIKNTLVDHALLIMPSIL